MKILSVLIKGLTIIGLCIFLYGVVLGITASDPSIGIIIQLIVMLSFVFFLLAFFLWSIDKLISKQISTFKKIIISFYLILFVSGIVYLIWAEYRAQNEMEHSKLYF